jgi:hypothetical protein
MTPLRSNGKLPPACARPETPDAGRFRRYAEGTAAVALWMGIGLVFRLSANAYLASGIPTALGFQRFARRGSLRAMRVRSAPPTRCEVSLARHFDSSESAWRPRDWLAAQS